MDDNTAFMLQDSNTESTSEFSSSSDTNTILESYQAFHIKPQSGPYVPERILSEKYYKLVDAIAYIDTGSHNTMMNPKILPPDSWKTNVHYFNDADNQIFNTNLISKNKNGIKIFPSCI
ncbi:hypothetical protein Ddye_024029 [Dipteronia dyeriana]|uniref:Uncharacterized protein n=1 Tax=Dipteronia dyeriana TaxID=168575 RepID=A0AAD9TU67_9ROSI|nr:hypothetical protein Ddye_024029 [Dipteronia dyeriana]